MKSNFYLSLLFALFYFGFYSILNPVEYSTNQLASLDSKNDRAPANESESCQSLLDKLMVKHIERNDDIRTADVKKFWKKHNGTYVGSIYHKGIRKLFKKMKTSFMDINANFRPIFYIEKDGASYPKIFKFIELKDPTNAGADTSDLKVLEDEINSWITSFKNYPDDMDNLISQFSVNATYITKLKELKKEKDIVYPFNLELDLYFAEGLTKYKRFIGNQEEIDEVIRFIHNKQKSIKGTSFFRIGKIDERDFNQALLAARLKSLETELYSHIATNPNSEEAFKPLLE